jgi:hypothetical protein
VKVVGRTLQDVARAGRDPKEATSPFRDWLSSVAKDQKHVIVGLNATFEWACV